MKKLLTFALALLMVAGCSNNGGGTATPTPSADANTDGENTGCTITIGLVTDLGGIDDKSFNQGTWEGVVKFAEDNKMSEDCYGYLQSSADADYIPNLSTFADQKKDLIEAPGFLFEDAMKEVADLYPDQKFVIIDTEVDKPNVASAVFKEQQPSYLVGVAAAMKAKEAGKIGRAHV